MSIKRLTRDAVLTAVALTIFMIELQIPSPVPIPGVKLGLANIVTVFCMFVLGPGDAGAVLLARVLLGSLFAGSAMSLLYSLAGGLACFIVMLLLRSVLSEKQIWVASVIAAAAHNMGQIAVAVLVTSTPSLIVYLPILMASGMLAGLFTGLCAQFAAARLKGLFK